MLEVKQMSQQNLLAASKQGRNAIPRGKRAHTFQMRRSSSVQASLYIFLASQKMLNSFFLHRAYASWCNWCHLASYLLPIFELHAEPRPTSQWSASNHSDGRCNWVWSNVAEAAAVSDASTDDDHWWTQYLQLELVEAIWPSPLRLLVLQPAPDCSWLVSPSASPNESGGWVLWRNPSAPPIRAPSGSPCRWLHDSSRWHPLYPDQVSQPCYRGVGRRP